jgi:hypothetical protein
MKHVIFIGFCDLLRLLRFAQVLTIIASIRLSVMWQRGNASYPAQTGICYVAFVHSIRMVPLIQYGQRFTLNKFSLQTLTVWGLIYPHDGISPCCGKGGGKESKKKRQTAVKNEVQNVDDVKLH